MHGIVFKIIKDFVVEQYDEATWAAIQEEAGVESKLYLPVSEYPDEEAMAIVAAASELSGIDRDPLLREVGRFAVPTLLDTYGVHVDDDWTALELVANTEEYIHESLREKQLSEFTPPKLRTRRVDEDTAALAYESDRGLCALAEGILDGVGAYMNEPLRVEHRRCVHDGAERCEMVIRAVPDDYRDGRRVRADAQ